MRATASSLNRVSARPASLNNQCELESADVVPGQGTCANSQGRLGLVSTSGSEEEAGERSSTKCPLSVGPGRRSEPLRPADHDISVSVAAPGCGRSAF